MKNKKGFTLIELLAVIIILGILMLIAIPSVTSYINNSRKNTYAETGANYVKATIPMAVDAKKVKLYHEGVLYMIPAGNDKSKTCVPLESGGASPYNKPYDYAYVGVTYDDDKASYSYYFTAVDGTGQGMNLVSYEELSSNGKESVKSGLNTSGVYTILKNNYGNDVVYCDLSSGCPDGSSSIPADLKSAMTTAGIDGDVVKTVEFIKTQSCLTDSTDY